MTTTQTLRDLYAILNPAVGTIKIGISGNVTKRLKALSAACGVPLELVAVMEQGESFEPFLHLIFDAQRQKGEWFDPSAEMLDLITEWSTVPEFCDRNRKRLSAAFRGRTVGAPWTDPLTALNSALVRIDEIRRRSWAAGMSAQATTSEAAIARVRATRAQKFAGRVRSTRQMRIALTSPEFSRAVAERQEALMQQRQRNAKLLGLNRALQM